MGFLGYSFVNLTKEQAHARRLLLDQYAFIAQLSVAVIIVGIQFYHLSAWLARRCGQADEESAPSSPYLKAGAEHDKLSWTRRAAQLGAKVRWWMGDEVAAGWGRKGEWVCGALWMGWLLALCIKDTGDDYMHLTKRFGIVAASQLPLHYLLAMKSAYSPLQLLARASHEQLNSAHRVLGRVLQCLFSLHAAFYLNFFIRINVLAKRIKDKDVILGLVCITIITITSTAAIAAIKKWNYRVFYSLHVVLATVFLPLAYFHVSHIRPYVLESAAVYVLHIILRYASSRTQSGSIALVPGADLVQVKIPQTNRTRQFRPGQHVYFSLPQGYRGSSIPNVFLQNPFTVASLPHKDGELVLVARPLDGNTRKLAQLARSLSLQDANAQSALTLKIEGPYGAAAHLPDLTSFDRILLVAGGVGATYIVPLWRTILELRRSQDPQFNADIRLIWAVRKLAETSWALPLPETESADATVDSRSEAQVFVTGDLGHASVGGSSEAMELEETETLVDASSEKALTEQGIAIKHGRPNLREIVDEAFSGHVGKAAVFVCGPAGMWKQLRREVRRQVWRGKDVYWHAEEFGL